MLNYINSMKWLKVWRYYEVLYFFFENEHLII